ncbi:uncharacterized protein C2845_PM11G16640 [Panicum miliaceum]|uniref:F-box protein AT5G49610-like beta-propeller domain-containing protein n=1 Tax=Panicum miliaceum TaxID=4540 RepID=A0A3L6RQ64_PANMI|nr:uncharacterized protein C2845_PM11G16640 [Panicum miliaceum]
MAASSSTSPRSCTACGGSGVRDPVRHPYRGLAEFPPPPPTWPEPEGPHGVLLTDDGNDDASCYRLYLHHSGPTFTALVGVLRSGAWTVHCSAKAVLPMPPDRIPMLTALATGKLYTLAVEGYILGLDMATASFFVIELPKARSPIRRRGRAAMPHRRTIRTTPNRGNGIPNRSHGGGMLHRASRGCTEGEGCPNPATVVVGAGNTALADRVRRRGSRSRGQSHAKDRRGPSTVARSTGGSSPPATKAAGDAAAVVATVTGAAAVVAAAEGVPSTMGVAATGGASSTANNIRASAEARGVSSMAAG